MTAWAVLATGHSMSLHVARAVMHKVGVIAVSDSWKLAPWCDVLVSSDRAWWLANPDAAKLDCEKYCGVTFDIPEGVKKFEGALSGSNSGLLGLKVAVSKGAKRILLCGVDLHGEHFFGQHKPPLKNATTARFEVFKRQFAQFRPKGVEIINCSLASALNCYPKKDLDACLAELEVHSPGETSRFPLRVEAVGI